MDEMKRILNEEKGIAEAKAKWEYYIPRITKQAQIEKGMQIEKSSITDENCKIKCLWPIILLYYHKIQELIALAILPYLVPDSRCKPEVEKIHQMAYVCNFIKNFIL